MAALASSSDLTARFDERLLESLVLDTGANETDLSANTRTTQALLTASGKVEAVAVMGGRYTAADLAGLTSGSNSEALLKQIVCSIAVGLIVKSRGYFLGDAERNSLLAAEQEALEWLDLLGNGKEIFADDSTVIEAGKPSADGPTTAELDDLYLVARNVPRLYPPRTLPFGR